MDFPSPWILPAAGPGRLMAGAATAPSVRHGGNDISCLPGLTMDLLTFKQIYTTCARQYSGTHVYTANKVFLKVPSHCCTNLSGFKSSTRDLCLLWKSKWQVISSFLKVGVCFAGFVCLFFWNLWWCPKEKPIITLTRFLSPRIQKHLLVSPFLTPAAKLLWGKRISNIGAKTLTNRQSFFTLLFCLHVFYR